RREWSRERRVRSAPRLAVGLPVPTAVGSTGCFSITEGVGFSSGAPPAHPRCSPFAALSPSQTHVRDLLRRSPWVRQGAFLLRRGWDSAPVRLRRILAALRSLRSLRVEPTFAIFFEDR